MLGIAPGAQALAYSVLEVAKGSPRAELLDADVLRAGRVTAKDAIDIMRRCHAHKMILDIVFERHPPAVLVLGPPANPKEPADHVAMARLAIRALAEMCKVPVTDLAGFPELYAAAKVGTPRQLTSLVRATLTLGAPMPRDKRAFTALASAVAGTRQLPA